MEKQTFGTGPDSIMPAMPMNKVPRQSFGLSHAVHEGADKKHGKQKAVNEKKEEPEVVLMPAAEAPEKMEPAAAVSANKEGQIEFLASPILRDYIRSMSDPNAIPIFKTASYDRGVEYKQRIEHYDELISEEIYNKIDPRVFAGDDPNIVRKEIAEAVEAVLQYRRYDLTSAEKSAVIKIMESDILGLGPLDELLVNDEISDIMVDGPNEVYIEMKGRISKTNIHFRSEEHLLNICYRIVNRVGREVSRASPICDARLPDGSRVNIILPPLSVHGPVLTIRKFKKEKITLDKLLDFGTIDQPTAALLQILSACRVNLLITGGTGSGKTTLLNCLTKYISPRERIITCEDVAELQLQQPQVVSLETRPSNIEGVGLVTMRDLVRNCLRMRPDRIIVGEVRGPEAFDLIQAMNTGHEGTMGTFHANSPRDALFRLENMVAMADLNIPTSAIRQQIASSLEVIVHTQRLRDGSRKVMNITEIVGMEEEIITMQDLVSYEITGEDENKHMTGRFKFSRLRPRFYEKARRYNFEGDLLRLMQGAPPD